MTEEMQRRSQIFIGEEIVRVRRLQVRVGVREPPISWHGQLRFETDLVTSSRLTSLPQGPPSFLLAAQLARLGG